MLERWRRAICARRFYRTLKSARWCLAVEPNLGVGSGTGYFETRPSRMGLERKSPQSPYSRDFLACLAISTRDVSLSRSVYMLCAILFRSKSNYSYQEVSPQTCIAPPLPSSARCLRLSSSNLPLVDSNSSAASCTLELKAMGWF